MKAVLFKAPGILDIIERNLPVPKGDELLIKIGACGILLIKKLQLESFPVSLLSLEEIQETISNKVKKSKSLKYQFNNQKEEDL